ncbi:MAG: hypothetical protein OEZ01_11130 [Candidatus Heimdallarchaeota archaeon]|nr:hypothetical protein [Candidatus Heimdallarchaeota archaeon]MDH5646555.1 hypothetical protein [Candidatus Heimdallarchaeota archaeon]
MLLILLFSGINLETMGEMTEFNSENSLNQSHVNNHYNSEDVFLSSLDILINRKNSSGSWKFNGYSYDDPYYFHGISGGLAGLGNQLLDVSQKSVSWITTDVQQQLVSIAMEIGDTLIDQGTITTNEAIWSIHNTTAEIDLGWDFGLAGIAAFFTKLYHISGITAYQNIANQTLTSIYNRANFTGGLHFLSQIPYFSLNWSWYPTLDFNYLTNEFNATFTGFALGTTGIAQAALMYQNYADTTEDYLDEMINSSLQFIYSNAIRNGNELSISMTSEDPLIQATSMATGVSGIGNFFIDLFNYNSNVTLYNDAMSIVQWLNGTSIDTPRSIKSWINDTEIIDETYEIGKTNGIAGVGEFLLRIAELENSEALNYTLDEVVYALYQSRSTVIDRLYQFPERFLTYIPLQQGSTSWAHGTGGIYAFLFDAASYLDDNFILSYLSNVKEYLLENVIEEGPNYAISDISSGLIELNPYIGLPGSLLYLSVLSLGKLSITTHVVNFNQVEVGNMESQSIEIKNIGEDVIQFNWSIPSTPFNAIPVNSLLSGRSSVMLNVTFNPTDEQSYESEIIVYSILEDISITIDIYGLGFDNPVLHKTSGLDNNSEIIERTVIHFEFEVMDGSGISSVLMYTNGQSPQSLTTIAGTSKYEIDWDLETIVNGTYVLNFMAIDLLGHNSNYTLVFTVLIYDLSVKDRIFSNTTIAIMIAVSVILIVIGVIVTRKYMS